MTPADLLFPCFFGSPWSVVPGIAAAGIGLLARDRDLLLEREAVFGKRGKEDIALCPAFQNIEQDGVGQFQAVFEDLLPADDKNLLGALPSAMFQG
jgi:hypothetical protein